MLNVPNFLTVFRILLVPVLVVVLLTKFQGKEFVGLGLFLLAALTDVLDGVIARRRKQVTRLGMLLDPAADKILTSAAFISLVEMSPNVVPAWIVVVIVAREFAVSALRAFAANERVVIPAGLSGKLKTVVQVVSIALLIIYNQLGEFRHLAPLSLWAALLVTIWSGLEYFIRFWRLVLRTQAPATPAPGPGAVLHAPPPPAPPDSRALAAAARSSGER
ncbi:MAG TPA: CDP-diacylglycerol--glycerol-3-phosphate 3-phosphatidyltransferase [Thermoanaerobaculia bacterium]|nr:CDP-diacylglycerol--glycerol-3-phosphate 3-phosphatidyltransferase [Thermoanaerobaculia bacterium]